MSTCWRPGWCLIKQTQRHARRMMMPSRWGLQVAMAICVFRAASVSLCSFSLYLSSYRLSSATSSVSPMVALLSLGSGKTATWSARWVTWLALLGACLPWGLMGRQMIKLGTICSSEQRLHTPATKATIALVSEYVRGQEKDEGYKKMHEIFGLQI